MPFSVLAVDDQASVLDLLRLLIERDDRLVLTGTAADGQAAVGHVQDECPDAIVCDVNMPVTDGLEALPLLRSACPHSVIVMYSSEPEAAAAAHDLGADEVVGKGGDPAELLDLVVALCRRRG